MKAVAADLKVIYRAISIEQAEEALLTFSEKWDKKYPGISCSWYKNWSNIITLFDYPDEIHKIIYTTNAIESLNRVIRKSINHRKIFPSDRSALKVVYLAIQKASQKWTMSLHDWRAAIDIDSLSNSRTDSPKTAYLHKTVYRLSPKEMGLLLASC